MNLKINWLYLFLILFCGIIKYVIGISRLNGPYDTIVPTTTPHSIGKAKEILAKIQSSFNKTFSYCESEVFYHDYIGKGNRLESVENRWLKTKAGMNGTLEKVCLLPNGLPVTRRCFYSHNVAVWEHIENSITKCLKQTRESIITAKLNSLQLNVKSKRNSSRGRHEIIRNLRHLLDEPNKKILPADIFFTNDILNKLTETEPDPELSQDMVGICSTLMSTEEQVLHLSAQINATNGFLETFEEYMDKLSENYVPSSNCGSQITTSIISTPTKSANNTQSDETVENISFSDLGVYALLTANVSVFFINPTCSQITGISIYDPKDGVLNSSYKEIKTSQQNFRYRFVYMNETVEDLAKEPGIQVATFLPQNLWTFVKQSLGKTAPHLILKIYSHDSLFVDPGNVTTCKPSSKIISISIPNFSGSFATSLPLILRNNDFSTKNTTKAKSGTGCGYWNYNTWVRNGIEVRSSNPLAEPVVICGTTHLTQFSFLVGGNYRQNEFGSDVLITPLHQKILDIISLVGCILSLLGLLGIWLTAIIAKSWRSLSSTKILLHMCVALTLQMVLFVFLNTDDVSEQLVKEKAKEKCIALGALLQYSTLVLFTWMLIIAFLQFQRYVTVIGIKRPPHYILKSAIGAWGFPLIPTLLVVFLDPNGYIPTTCQLRSDTGICYPSGYGLIFGVVLPVTLVCIANLAIYIYVFYSISHTLSQSMQRSEKQMIVKQIRLSVLLFFLLGLSWIFGIFAFMGAGIVFSYLFCSTATLQGLVLFIFFVLLDEVPRKSWEKFLHISKSTKTEKKELQSITTSSGLPT